MEGTARRRRLLRLKALSTWAGPGRLRLSIKPAAAHQMITRHTREAVDQVRDLKRLEPMGWLLNARHRCEGVHDQHPRIPANAGIHRSEPSASAQSYGPLPSQGRGVFVECGNTWPGSHPTGQTRTSPGQTLSRHAGQLVAANGFQHLKHGLCPPCGAHRSTGSRSPPTSASSGR